MYAVILAGGKGTRFWPLSRRARPKQFLDMTGEGSMISLTYARLSSLVSPEKILLVTVAEQERLVREAVPQIPKQNIFAEPSGRNTAPSLAVAAAMVRARGSDEPVLCCPSDHVIEDAEGFAEAAGCAEAAASSQDVLVTFGIEPTFPATGYGYIESGDPVGIEGAPEGHKIFRVKRFHEKPGLETASAYMEKGNFFWNSGIFMWRPSVLLDAWSRFFPEGVAPLEKLEESFSSDGCIIEDQAELYSRMPAVSVDYGILEKADNIIMVRGTFDWNDVGSWDALFDLLAEDDQGNRGAGQIVAVDSKGNLFFNPNGCTAAIGVEDLIVAVDRGTVLVCRRNESQKVRQVLEMLEAKGKKELL